MAWAVKTDDYSDYFTTSDIVLPANQSFDIEFLYAFENEDYGRVFGRTADNDFTSRVIIYYSSQNIIINDSSGNGATFVIPSYTRTDFNKYRFVRDASGNLDFYLNDVLVGSETSFTGAFVIQKLLSQSNTESAAPSKCQYLKFDANGSALRYFDSTLSSHASGSPVWTDTVSGLNGTASAGMPTDGTAWINLDVSLSVDFTITGGVTSSEAKISGKISGSTSALKIEYADNALFSDSKTTGLIVLDEDFLAKVILYDLTNDTKYYYRYVDDGTPISGAFSFNTVKIKEIYSHKMVFGTCIRSGYSTASWQKILDEEPLFIQFGGDFTYHDSEDVTGVTQKTAIFNMLETASVRLGNDNIAFSYMWDDHDYGGNDSDASNPAKTVMQEFYRSLWPSHNLQLSSGSIYYSYIVGRVKYIILDVRSERAGSKHISETQMDWVKSEFTEFYSDPNLKAFVLSTGTPWGHTSGDDTWQGAAAQRTEIMDHIVSLGIQEQGIIISGDAHQISYDDGTNTKFDTSGTVGLPVCHAAPIGAHTGAGGGGPYTGGVFADSESQYGVLEIIDSESSINLKFSGYRADQGVPLIVAEHIININSSTLNMTETDTPDGTYSADIYNNGTKTLIETRNITFSGGDASETIPLDSGAEVLVFIEGDNPPVTGIAYIEVTE